MTDHYIIPFQTTDPHLALFVNRIENSEKATCTHEPNCEQVNIC